MFVTHINANLKNTLATKLDKDNDAITAYQGNYSYHYQAAAADNVVVKASAGVLVGIILGGVPIADASIEISDHATDGDGNIVAHPSGGSGADNLLEQTLVDKHKGFIKVGMAFATVIAPPPTMPTTMDVVEDEL